MATPSDSPTLRWMKRRGHNAATRVEMKARLIRMGNSRGVRLPKAVIEGAGLQEDVELYVRGNTVVIGPRKRPRLGWGEAAKQMRQAGDERLLERVAPTRFDEREWRWR